MMIGPSTCCAWAMRPGGLAQPGPRAQPHLSTASSIPVPLTQQVQVISLPVLSSSLVLGWRLPPPPPPPKKTRNPFPAQVASQGFYALGSRFSRNAAALSGGAFASSQASPAALRAGPGSAVGPYTAEEYAMMQVCVCVCVLPQRVPIRGSIACHLVQLAFTISCKRV